MANRKIPDAIQQQVRQRASELCEYCHASEKWQYVLFTVDHVIPLSQNGGDNIDNLAFRLQMVLVGNFAIASDTIR